MITIIIVVALLLLLLLLVSISTDINIRHATHMYNICYRPSQSARVGAQAHAGGSSLTSSKLH